MILIYCLITTALYYLGAHAEITQFMWSRYPKWLEKLTLCPACEGFWTGLICGGVGAWKRWSVMGMDGRDPVTVVIIGLMSVAWTPLLAEQMLNALDNLGKRGQQ